MKALIPLLTVFWALYGHAEIHKWVDENGKVHFGDKVPEKYKTVSTEVETNTNVVDNENLAENKKTFEQIKRDNALREQNNNHQNYRLPNRSAGKKEKPLRIKGDCSTMPSKAAEIRCRRKYNQF